MSDAVKNPSHYGQGSIECLDYIEDTLTEEEYIGYLRGNIIKYNHRFRYKGKALEDLKKAKFYHNRLIDLFERKENGQSQLTFRHLDPVVRSV